MTTRSTAAVPIRKLAELLNCTRSEAHVELSRARIPTTEIRGKCFVAGDLVDAWLAQQTAAADARVIALTAELAELRRRLAMLREGRRRLERGD